MNDQDSRRTFVATMLATLAALLARPGQTLAQTSAKADPLARDAQTLCSIAAPANITTYVYDQSARLISITHAAIEAAKQDIHPF